MPTDAPVCTYDMSCSGSDRGGMLSRRSCSWRKISAKLSSTFPAISIRLSEAEAAALLAKAEADRKVVEARTTAEADVLKQEVAAYGGEANYVRAKLYEKTAPRLRDVVTGDSPGEIFGLPIRERKSESGKGGAK